MLQCLGYGPQTFNSASGLLVLGVFFRLVFLSALKTTLDSQRQYSNILVKYASVFEVSRASLHPASVIQVVVWCTLTVLCTNELAAVYFYSQYVITKDLHGQGETKMAVTLTFTPPSARYTGCHTAGEKPCSLQTLIIALPSCICVLCLPGMKLMVIDVLSFDVLTLRGYFK